MTKIKQGRALVTGASAGIGAVYADRLAARGFDLILTARDAARLEASANRLRAEYGVAVDVVPADLASPAGVKTVERRLRDDGDVTLLINNAGIAEFGSLGDADSERLEQMIQVNVLAVARLAQAAAVAFRERGGGDIVIVSSAVAISPSYPHTAYGATKAFGLYLALSANLELEGTGVRVQAVLPGMTRTEIWERSGRSVESLPEGAVMDAIDLVEAALVGLERGERVTIPSLEDMVDWNAFEVARDKLSGLRLSKERPAARYGLHQVAPGRSRQRPPAGPAGAAPSAPTYES